MTQHQNANPFSSRCSLHWLAGSGVPSDSVGADSALSPPNNPYSQLCDSGKVPAHARRGSTAEKIPWKANRQTLSEQEAGSPQTGFSS
jgi:hypothetical protein